MKISSGVLLASKLSDNTGFSSNKMSFKMIYPLMKVESEMSQGRKELTSKSEISLLQ